MSSKFEVTNLQIQNGRIEVDFTVQLPKPIMVFELTFSRDRIEKDLNVSWEDFCKVIQEVADELKIIAEREGERQARLAKISAGSEQK